MLSWSISESNTPVSPIASPALPPAYSPPNAPPIPIIAANIGEATTAPGPNIKPNAPPAAMPASPPPTIPAASPTSSDFSLPDNSSLFNALTA